MWSALILAGLLRAAVPRTPTRARSRRERRHGPGTSAVGTLRRRLLVLDAQLAERERPTSRMAADPQHGHAATL